METHLSFLMVADQVWGDNGALRHGFPGRNAAWWSSLWLYVWLRQHPVSQKSLTVPCCFALRASIEPLSATPAAAHGPALLPPPAAPVQAAACGHNAAHPAAIHGHACWRTQTLAGTLPQKYGWLFLTTPRLSDTLDSATSAFSTVCHDTAVARCQRWAGHGLV